MKKAAFWLGMGAGLAVGAAVGMACAPKQHGTKTCVGRAMHRAGCALDDAFRKMTQCIS